MKKTGLTAISVSAMFFWAICIAIAGTSAVPLQAQSASSQTQSSAAASSSDEAKTAKIHGHAQDPLYRPITNTKVEITRNGKTALYTFKTDAEGNYSGSGIKPGTYSVMLYGQIKGKNGQPKMGIMDFQKNVKFTAGSNVEVNFNLARPSYVSQLPEATQEKIKTARKANATAAKANVSIKNANQLIQQARKERAAGNYEKAIALETKATQAKPDVGLTWYELADTQLRAKKYSDAAANFQKALAAMAAQKNPKQEIVAIANNNLGEALARLGKVKEAAAAYEAAVKADPSKAGQYYQNEAIVFFKKGDGAPALAAANKAIAADPKAATAYFIKGWALLQKATINQKTGKIQLHPGTAEAYRKYLQLQPNGPLAPRARNILKQAGEPAH